MQSPRRDKGSEEPLVVNDKLELWGGLECTINRVGNTWMDQMRRCGHTERPGDLQLIRELGIRKLRYGLQWERYMQAGSLEVFRDSLAEMERLGMEPIAGLVHHGSGPEGTDLLDPEFGTKLAGYARQVAARFPSVRSYTPVNEPHTTARFSGLYAHWYPHHRSFRAYLRALVNQVKASVLAMEAIREVRPDAEFVHTEDAGRTWSTPELAPLCELRENRRWLGTDLLCGRVGRDHPLFPYLLSHGISEAEIFWFAEHPCPPSVLGLNYYVTSDRFLDHRTERYPDWLAGGDDGTEPLVDIEAVRLRRGGIAGSCEILREAWERYGLPVAITEAHLGGDPAEQVRWLRDVWKGAQAARRSGVDCRAVTVWAMLGSFDWCTLVTEERGDYEPGVFDVGGGPAFQEPVPTHLAAVVAQLARGERPAVEGPGWWTLPSRMTFEPVDEHETDNELVEA